MARVSEKHPCYRTREQICEDVARVLRSSLSYGTKHAVLANAVWVWSEFEGKIKGCSRWSRAARSNPTIKGLIHEHVVPKSVLIRMLFDLSNPTTEAVAGILDRFCIGVVVTRDEDKRLTQAGVRRRMPDDWDGRDVWVRHRLAGIDIE